MLLQVAGTTACRVTVHTYTQLRAELTAVVLAASTPLVVVGQVVLTLRGPHELLHVAARHEHDGIVEQVVIEENLHPRGKLLLRLLICRGFILVTAGVVEEFESPSTESWPRHIYLGHSWLGSDSRIVLASTE